MGRGGAPFLARSPDGEIIEETNLAGFCREHDLDDREARRIMEKRAGTHKGWQFRRPGDSDTFNTLAGLDTDTAGELAQLERMLGGKEIADPRKLVAAAMNATLKMSIGMVDGILPPQGWNPANVNKACEMYCRTQGIDLKHAIDQRTPDEKFIDNTSRLIANGLTILETIDEELDVMETQLARIDLEAPKYMAHLEGMKASEILPAEELPEDQDPGGPPGPKCIAAAAKKMIDRIRRVRHLAHRAREASDPGMTPRERVISEATHSLRYMLYVNRADLSVSHPGVKKRNNVYLFGHHHVRMAMGYYMSRHKAGVGIVPGRVLFPGDRYIQDGREIVFEGAPYSATMFMIPPRHSKTDFLKALVGLSIGLNPRIQIAYVHDGDDGAKVFHASVRDMFNTDESQGRRNHRLFPYELAGKDNNTEMLRVRVANPPRCPNLLSSGMRCSYQGINLDLLIGDDLVPTKDVDHPTDRRRRFVVWAGTWISRLQGDDPHVIYSGYPRHFEDLMYTKLQDGRRSAKTGFRDGEPIWVLRMPVGGPQSKVPFEPIWPEMYPAKWLRQQYKRMNNPPTYAANYMCQPLSEESKIVRKIRLLDIDDPAVKLLIAHAENHLSVDPAAKGDGQGDKAGMVTLSIGDLVTRSKNEHGEMTHRETLGVVLHPREFDASQFEIMDEMRSAARRMPIHMAHVECVNGLGTAIVEALRKYHNVHGVNQINATTNKKVRFKAVAGMIEHADPLLPAKIAFLGQRPKDSSGEPIPDAPLEPLPEYEKLISYIINFAVEDGFHSLDALTQVCNACMYRLGVGDGAFSAQVEQDDRAGIDPRKKQYAERVRKAQHKPGRRRFSMSSMTV